MWGRGWVGWSGDRTGGIGLDWEGGMWWDRMEREDWRRRGEGAEHCATSNEQPRHIAEEKEAEEMAR